LAPPFERNITFVRLGFSLSALMGFAMGLALVQPVGSQDNRASVSAEDAAAYDAAFQETLSHPADPPILIKFATIAVKVGDLEGAISALERLLLIDGDNPEVQLELGVLYFRLGSMAGAKSYLEAASKSRRASPETKTRASAFLKEASRP
jgi:uncharacterized protein HemY